MNPIVFSLKFFLKHLKKKNSKYKESHNFNWFEKNAFKTKFTPSSNVIQNLVISLSVIGKKFYYDTLEALEQKLDESSNIKDPINELVEQNFLMNEHLKKDLYLFKNILTQQVSYKSVLRSNRKLLHGLIADILENSYKDRKEEFIEDLSHHYYLSEDNSKAKEYLELAIKKVKKLHALNLAKDYYQKLIDVYTHEYAQLSHVLEGGGRV